MTPEEAAFRRLALLMNQIDSNEAYSVGVANSDIILYREVSSDERHPFMELHYSADHGWRVFDVS